MCASADAGCDESKCAGVPAEAEEDPSRAQPSDASFVALALVGEGGLALVGWTVGNWSGINWGPMIQLHGHALLLGVGGGLGLVVCHLLLIFPGGTGNPLYRTIYLPLREVLRAPMQTVRVVDIFLLALASGVGEEVFFRGWLQTQVGLGMASVIFGACHVWGKEALPYGLYATGMGILLGVLFESTGRLLWAPVVAHVVNNLVGLLALKYGLLPGTST